MPKTVIASYNAVNTLLGLKRQASVRVANGDGSDGSGAAGLLLGDAIPSEPEEPPGVLPFLAEDLSAYKDTPEEEDAEEELDSQEESQDDDAEDFLVEDASEEDESLSLDLEDEIAPADVEVAVEDLTSEGDFVEAEFPLPEDDVYQEEDELDKEEDFDDEESEELEEDSEDELDEEEELEEDDELEEETEVDEELAEEDSEQELHLDSNAPTDEISAEADTAVQDNLECDNVQATSDSSEETQNESPREDAVLELTRKDPAVRLDLYKTSYKENYARGFFCQPKPARALPKVVPAPAPVLFPVVPRLIRT